jgi:hypothetical protein
MWRAYSSIIPTSASRSDIGPPPLPCWFRGSSAVMSRLGASAANRVAKSASARHASHASATIRGSGTAPSKSPSRSVSEQNNRGASSPAISTRNVARSISARCRTSPRSDVVDGSTERRAMASASRPAHFISSARRWQRRVSVGVTRSSPSLALCSRGSSSEGLPSAVGMSARGPVPMAAITGDRPAVRQRIYEGRPF